MELNRKEIAALKAKRRGQGYSDSTMQPYLIF